jgi:hypothetical protein
MKMKGFSVAGLDLPQLILISYNLIVEIKIYFSHQPTATAVGHKQHTPRNPRLQPWETKKLYFLLVSKNSFVLLFIFCKLAYRKLKI